MKKAILWLQRYFYQSVFCVALVLLFITSNSGVSFQNFSIKDEAGSTNPILVPFLMQGRGAGKYELSGEMVLGWFAPKSYTIVPDDVLLSLTVNGLVVDLSKFPSNLLSDVNQGVTLDLSPLLHAGSNKITIKFQDAGGDMGMRLNRNLFDWRMIFLSLSWILLVSTILIISLQRLGLSKIYSALYTIIAYGILIRIWYIFTYNPVNHIFSDPERHWVQGIDVLRQDLMSLTDPIGYQLYIALLGKFTLKLPGLVAYCTSILAVLGSWFWYRFFRELQSSKPLALLGWALLCLLPSWTAIYGYFMQETLFLPLLGAALWATWRCRRKNDAASFGIMVLIWMTAGLTRGIAIPMAAVACSWLWLAQDLKVKKALYSMVVLLAVLGPLTYRSYLTVNHFAPHGMGHLNIIYARSGKKVIDINVEGVGRWWFGSPSTGAKPFAPFSDWATQRTGTVQVQVDLKEGMKGWQSAKDSIKMDWRDYAWITQENLIFLFFADSWPDYRPDRLIDQIASTMRWIWVPLCLSIIVLLIIDAKKRRGQWLLPAIIAAWLIIQGVIPIAINEGRYRKPLEGLLIGQIILLMASRKGLLRRAAILAPREQWGAAK